MFANLIQSILGKTAHQPNYEIFQQLNEQDAADVDQTFNQIKQNTHQTHKQKRTYQDVFYDYLLGESAESENSEELTGHVYQLISEVITTPHLIVEHMPVMPASVSLLMKQLKEDNFDLNAVIDIITIEPSVAAALINQANQVNRSGRDVTDLKHAFMLLGADGLKAGVLSAFIEKFVPPSNIYYKLFGQKIWAHAQSVAQYAEKITAVELGNDYRETAYFVGLISDIGHIVIFNLMIEAFKHVSPNNHPGSQIFKALMAEKANLLTQSIAKEWALPDMVTEALLFKRTNLTTQITLGSCVYDARTLAVLAALLEHKKISSLMAEQLINKKIASVHAQNLALSLL